MKPKRFIVLKSRREGLATRAGALIEEAEIRVGDPRRLRAGETLTVAGIVLEFVAPGHSGWGADHLIELRGKRGDIAARIVSALRSSGINTTQIRKTGRIRLKAAPLIWKDRDYRGMSLAELSKMPITKLRPPSDEHLLRAWSDSGKTVGVDLARDRQDATAFSLSTCNNDLLKRYKADPVKFAKDWTISVHPYSEEERAKIKQLNAAAPVASWDDPGADVVEDIEGMKRKIMGDFTPRRTMEARLIENLKKERDAQNVQVAHFQNALDERNDELRTLTTRKEADAEKAAEDLKGEREYSAKLFDLLVLKAFANLRAAHLIAKPSHRERLNRLPGTLEVRFAGQEKSKDWCPTCATLIEILTLKEGGAR